MSMQIRENIIFEGEEMFTASHLPLPKEQGLVEKTELPEINSDEVSFRERVRLIVKNPFSSTACRRRYIGTWEIKNDKLYLLDIRGSYKIISKTPIFAKWFSGSIVITSGERLKMALNPRYEIEKDVEIENGVVKNIKTIDNKERAIKEGWEKL